MVVGFTTTCAVSTTKVVSSNPAHVGVYSIQHYVIKFAKKDNITFIIQEVMRKITLHLLYKK
jgi:hypothetical protein